MTIRSLAVSAAAIVIVANVPTPACAQQRTYTFDIPAGDLAIGIRAFATVSRQQVSFDGAVVAGKRGNAVKGRFAPEQALARLLERTGVGFRRADRGVFVLSAEGNATDAADAAPSKQEIVDGESTALPEGNHEIVITGTHIPGAVPAAPLRIIDRAEIDRSGYSTTGELIRSVPQAFSGNINPGVTGVGNALTNNFSGTSTADLRGLGPGSTLTLVNGHRMAYDGILNSVDISAIPLPAVKRVDILLDGASAIYGSDAVAGVVNFILRKDYDGAESQVRIGRSADGGASERQASQLVGKTWSTGNVLANLEYHRQGELFASEREFSKGAVDPLTLIPQQDRVSLYVSGNQQLSSRLSAFIDALYSRKHVHAGQGLIYYSPQVDVDYKSKVDEIGITGGFDLQLGKDWKSEIAATYSRNNDHTTQIYSRLLTPYLSGATNELKSIELSAAGPMLQLPAGPLSLAFGAGVRREQIDREAGDRPSEGGSRDIKYAYGELIAPVFESGAMRLTASSSARYEHYSDFGSVFTPKLGLAMSSGGLTVRGTWGKSFRAPALVQLYGNRFIYLYPASTLRIPDPDTSSALVILGANRALGPERAKSWTIGTDYRFKRIPNLKLSATYFSADYVGRIAVPFGTLVGVFDSPQVQPFILKDPDPQVQQEIISSGAFFNLTGEPYDPSRVRAIFLADYRNLRAQHIRGVDGRVDYSARVGTNQFSAFVDLSYLDLEQKDAPSTPERQLSGRIFFPPKFKARGGINWSHEGLSASAILNWVGGSIDNSGSYVYGASETARPVDAWTTVDGQIAYDTGEAAGLVGGLRISLSISNLFNAKPPLVTADSTSSGYKGLGYDSANASPVGRFTSITLRKRW
jgi:outer membrane receptor protein involved in Fe transport